MTLHREGNKILLVWGIFLILLNVLAFYFFKEYSWVLILTGIITAFLFFLFAQFFRVPKRNISVGEQNILSPCDGKVVVIENVMENEYLKEECTQISIFMSPLNVHVNFAPISGEVEYYKYHEGLYLVAWHPKSSTENERTTVVVRNEAGVKVLFRQIAGAVARRICCYVDQGDQTEQGKEFGFIKFGSRCDVFIPKSSKIKVSIDDKVVGAETILATV